MPQPPLAGLRVLDLTRLLPGPFATMMLADLGAEVTKVEEPERGDYTRWNRVRVGHSSAYFLAINRGKRSVALNLKHPEGRAALLRLAERADVVIEGFRPGVVDRLGVGYEMVSSRNRSVVYCALTGYGQTGPYRDRAGHDNNYLGYAGVLSLTGDRDGPPRLLGIQVADLAGGAQQAVAAILAALYHREKTGEGQYLDVAMMDGAFYWQQMYLANLGVTGQNPRRGAERLSGGVPGYGLYETKDGRWLTVGALEPQFWKRLLTLIGREDLLALDAQPQDDPSYARMAGALAEAFRARTLAEWTALLAHEEVCVGPVLELDEAVRDPQVIARALAVRQPQPGAGDVLVAAYPTKFSRTPARAPAPAPALGEHTDAVLAEAGYTADEIAALRKGGAV